MINLHLSVINPWHNDSRWPWRDFYQHSWSVTKNKTLDLCIDFYPYTLAHLKLNTRWTGQDHAGPELSFGILGFGIAIGLRDHRHWDYDTNTWAKHD